MLMALLLAAAGQPPAARDIAAFCKSGPACIDRQKVALKHYLGIWVMFDVPKAQAETCMRGGKVGSHVDWLKAEACMRSWSKGRQPLTAGAKASR